MDILLAIEADYKDMTNYIKAATSLLSAWNNLSGACDFWNFTIDFVKTLFKPSWWMYNVTHLLKDATLVEEYALLFLENFVSQNYFFMGASVGKLVSKIF